MAACGSDDRSLHVAIFGQALESQHSDGSWGSDDTPSMKPCFTAQTIDMIWHLENKQGLDDTASLPTLMSTDRVQRAVSWLKSEQHPDGSWGEDAWDTCQVLKSLALAGLTAEDPAVSSGLGYLRSNIDQGWPDRASFWFGPGFYGSSMEAFNRFKDQRYANIALDGACKYFDEDDGCFRPLRDEPESLHAPAEWHTACVISGLRSFGSVAPQRGKALRAATWLAAQQTQDGSWSPGHYEITAYCTNQAIVALSSNAMNKHNTHARRGTDWFLKKCEEKNTRLSTKLMAAAAIARTHSDGIVVTLPLSFVMELGDIMNMYSLQVSSLNTEAQIAKSELRSFETKFTALRVNDATLAERQRQSEEKIAELEAANSAMLEADNRMKAQFSSYALKLTPNQLAILGILISVISVLMGLIASIFVSTGSR